MSATPQRSFSVDELRVIAQNFRCPTHPEEEISGFFYAENIFGCTRCTNGQRDSSEFQTIESSAFAVEFVDNFYKGYAYCTKHPRVRASKYCYKEARAVCPTCQEDCQGSDHSLQQVEQLYEEKRMELDNLTDFLRNYDKTKLAVLISTVQEFHEGEIDRVNQAFDDYRQMVEDRRLQALKDVKIRMNKFCWHTGIIQPLDLNKWEKEMERLNFRPKVDVIRSFYADYKDSGLDALVRKMTKFQEDHERVYAKIVENRKLKSKTFFCRNKLPDLSKMSVTSSKLESQKQGWRDVELEIRQLRNQFKALQTKEWEISKSKEAVYYDDFQEAMEMIWKRYSGKILDLYRARVRKSQDRKPEKQEGLLNISISLDVHIQKQVEELCKQYRSDLEALCWNIEKKKFIYDDEDWDNEVAAGIIKGFFAGR